MKKFASILILLVSVLGLNAQERVHHVISHQGLEREYYLYVPDSLDANRPLVIMLHGYGSRNVENYNPAMTKTAKDHGFVLCVPKGWPSPKDGKAGWNVRYPRQDGQTSDDVAFVLFLAETLQKEYNLGATFLTGMSNGGEMCYIMAWLHPEKFRAIASIAGLTMRWLPDENDHPKGHVPFMEVHGTGDHTSEFGGDPQGDFGWGPYISVPLAVGHIASIDRCTCEQTSVLPRLKDDSHDVILHRYLDGVDGCEVRLYEVLGGKHSWALNDLDTCEEVWNFFALYL